MHFFLGGGGAQTEGTMGNSKIESVFPSLREHPVFSAQVSLPDSLAGYVFPHHIESRERCGSN